MLKLNRIVGNFFIGIAIVFLISFSMIVSKEPDEPFARDLFGFAIPTPPTWTVFIPYLGYILNFIFEAFSLHGLVQLSVFIVLLGIGITFSSKAKEQNH
ncbi:MAG: hypothetical protein COU90_04040 [Candidatus Ryanbacteria bacterium CG10_big_fil_rev_8_21_14_0_10_43_42]|uniref:Uncharacterized protein n=1 Tax=Candidatus Ryanbacteria bacterium CG10_big_fil_rev_8_21_14_0_10_43_42 TaxID=1974864 RepID=A0A2M8KWG7_9BACT|nr:MAG: hypothetical protein COU90_04040 [Candidatus Ryanbacteria bacterium CG10_big_fil_rev_8_21_14_0_10_43_42]